MFNLAKPKKYLFIVGQGRDGSTLLQNLLNNSPRVQINGENILALQLASAVGVLANNPNYGRNRGVSGAGLDQEHPWFGIDQIEIGELVQNLRKLIIQNVLRPDKRDLIIGFKEIRWLDLPKVFEGNQSLFPDAQYIFLERDTEEMMNSGWWFDLNDGTKIIEKRKHEFQSIAESLCKRVLSLRYEGLISNPSVRADLEVFLGVTFDQASWKKTLNKQLSHKKGSPPWQILSSRVPLS